MKFRTTPEEREIISMLDTEKIEQWINKEEYWRIYRAVIKATKEYISDNNEHGKG